MNNRVFFYDRKAKRNRTKFSSMCITSTIIESNRKGEIKTNNSSLKLQVVAILVTRLSKLNQSQ